MADSGLAAVIVATGFGVSTHPRALRDAGIEVRALVGRNPEKTLDVPEDLVNPAAEPPPAEFMLTTYDHLHAGGFDLGPYTKLCALLRDRVLGKDTLKDPAAATFADGVAGQRVLDAIRLSSAERCWVDIE